MKRFSLALIFLMSLLLTPTTAQDDVTATNADARGDNELALGVLEHFAKRGDVPAAYKLGLIYNNGEGVKQNFTKAVSWFSLAAAQDYAPAQYSLGIKYEKGQGVQRNYGEAVKWYRHSAEQGDATAQYRLGRLYAQGRGVERDYVEAIEWFDLAAAQGVEDAGAAREAVASVLIPPQIAQVQRQISAKPATQPDIEPPQPEIEPDTTRAGQTQSYSNSMRGGAEAYRAADYRRADEIWASLGGH